VMGIYVRRKRLIWAGLLLSAFFSAAAIGSDVLVVGVHRYWWGYYPRYGWLGIPFLTFFSGLGLANLRDYWVEYRKAEPGTHKLRLRALLIAFNFAYLGGLDYLPCYGVPLYPFGYLPVFVCLVLTARVAQRYRLVDIVPAFAANEILATMADPLAVCDADGRIRIVNQALCATLGYTQQELLGERIECLAGADSGGVERLRQLLSLCTARDEETVLRTQAGEPVAVSISLSPLQDGGRNRLGTVLIARDIREQKQAGAALRASEERLRLITDTIDEVFWMADVKLAHLFYVSPAYGRIWGRTPESVYQNPGSFIDAIHPEDRQRVVADYAVEKSGRPFDHEYRIIRPDGSVLWIWSRGFPVHDPAGHISRYVGIAQDITGRKRMEAQLLQANTFLDSIVENIPDMVFVKDAKRLEYVLFNRAGAEVFTHRRADLIGKNDYDLFPKEEADFFTEKDRAVLHNKALLDIPEEPIKTAQHGARILHTKKIPLLDDKGEAAYLLGISEDITDRQHAEQMQRRHERETTTVNDILRAINTHL